MNNLDPIGFFDSGLGGISVLKESVKLMPNENYIYYGDSANAPYGIKTAENVKALTDIAVEKLINIGVKAIVIACNTATSAGIDFLRNKYLNIPIIGVEPALKPAVERFPHGRIIIMATDMTLKEEKFRTLWSNYGKDAEIIPLPCKGLMEYVEKGITEGDELEKYLQEKFSVLLHSPIDAIVLGCTHYPFVKNAIQKIVGKSVMIIDGGQGTARQLFRQLETHKLLNTSSSMGKISFFNSSDDPSYIKLSQKLFEHTEQAE